MKPLPSVRRVGVFVLLAGVLAGSLRAVTIMEAEHEGRAQLKIATAAATFFYDRAGGGFSRLPVFPEVSIQSCQQLAVICLQVREMNFRPR